MNYALDSKFSHNVVNGHQNNADLTTGSETMTNLSPQKTHRRRKKITATLRLCINISSLQPRQRPPEDNGQKGTNNAACLLRGVPPNTWLLWFSSPAAINFPDAEYPTIIYPQRNNNAKKRKKKEQTGSRLEKLWYYLSTFLKVIRRTKSNSKILS